MSKEEQAAIKTAYYTEAVRYMDNAMDALKKAGKEYGNYKDDKYVKTACATAYSGVLKALDGYFALKGVPKPKGRRSIEYYQVNIAKLDRKLSVDLDNA